MKRRTYLKNDARYIVKKEEGIIVCILKCDMQLSEHPCYLNSNFGEHSKKYPSVDNYGRFTVSATSKCHKDDIFDEIKGKRIALYKASIKAFAIAEKVYKVYGDSQVKAANIYYNNMNNCHNIVLDKSTQLNNLLK